MLLQPEHVAAAREWVSRQGPVMNPGSLLARLQKGAGLESIVMAHACLRALERAGEISCKGWVQLEPAGQVRNLIGPKPVSAGEQAWRDAVDAHPVLTPPDKENFVALWSEAVAGWPQASFAHLIDEIVGIRCRPPAETLYLTSASGRLGSSKLLSALPRQALLRLGIESGAEQAPPCFLVAGPRSPEAVVLVENPNAFERAISVTQDMPICWISAYGFGASSLNAGERLAEGLASGKSAVSASRMGDPPPLEDLLANGRLHLWGDLDLSGLHIAHRLRRRFPHLVMSSLYSPMVDLLRAGGGHPYVQATGKADQGRASGGVPSDMKWLAELCRERAVDQEHLTGTAIREHAGKPLQAREK